MEGDIGDGSVNHVVDKIATGNAGGVGLLGFGAPDDGVKYLKGKPEKDWTASDYSAIIQQVRRGIAGAGTDIHNPDWADRNFREFGLKLIESFQCRQNLAARGIAVPQDRGSGTAEPPSDGQKNNPSSADGAPFEDPSVLKRGLAIKKAAQIAALADPSLNPFGKMSARSAQSPRAEDAKEKPHYRAAEACVTVVKAGPEMLGNILQNTCSFAVSVGFCTRSARNTGAFACGNNQWGGDVIAPGKTAAIMGAGVPESDDPFELITMACEAPGIPKYINARRYSCQ
ncbi:hypothetical protein QA648_36670 (plasmid) [Rhizobium sp. CB3171]|uniref:hypothetical protein n=1 Tax=Rhizobium sp. CB3171 TaxID=3039157 RepID=UPI0024B20BD0|nr:hypothetical protein [Rhizobium sp. CB3171]WFU07461.1 hypothetical protein QA648_36670 [Rhizobium sp. CB3171]